MHSNSVKCVTHIRGGGRSGLSGYRVLGAEVGEVSRRCCRRGEARQGTARLETDRELPQLCCRQKINQLQVTNQ